jgi:prepilin-type N-terminal cleavage/methylation domain-containing protein
MKKAFTLIELIFVIVIAAIIAVMALPKTQDNSLATCAHQVVSHINYTKHLALIDDKFDPNDNGWYKSRWQIMFNNNKGSGNGWSYTVFSDWTGTHSGNPDPDEVAQNPRSPNQLLTGGTSGSGLVHYGDKEISKELNIGKKYGITGVTFSGGCPNSSKRIAFDRFGRPIKGNLRSQTSAYQNDRMMTSTCTITLTNSSGSIQIAVEPETGYAHIL